MKKILVAFGAFAMAFAATAELDTLITFSTKGPDKYLDGNTVMDGECYALVWTKNGTFAGLNADGSCVDSENNALVLVAPIAKDGKCPPVMYVVKANVAEQYKDGTYGIYLLDTRVPAAKDGDGNVLTYKVNGVNASSGKPTNVKGYAAIQEGVKSKDGELASTSASASVQVAVLPADAPTPKITGIKLVGDKVHLTVTDTISDLAYGVASGTTAEEAAAKKQSTGAKVGGGESLTLIVDKPEGNTGFFKVQPK